jgi:ankyrin repeat protein
MDDIEQLFLRVGIGDASLVAEMLRYRPELARAPDASGLSVLRFARYMREDRVLDLLIDAGPPLDVFEAAALDRAAQVRELLAQDASLALAYDADGSTPVHVAAASDAPAVIRALLDAGALVDTLSGDGQSRTPLHSGVAAGAPAACRELLRAGADPNARLADGATPLMAAAAGNRRELVEMLIARNANVEWRDHAGRTAADVAAAAGYVALAARLRVGEWVVDRRTV